MAETETQAKEYSWQGREFGQEVVTVASTGMRKKGIIVEPAETSQFEVVCDEGTHLGGEDSAPRPITYFLLSVGFCALTQLHRYGDMMKVDLRNAKVTVKSRFRTDGSVLKGTVQAKPVGFQVRFEVEFGLPARPGGDVHRQCRARLLRHAGDCPAHAG